MKKQQSPAAAGLTAIFTPVTIAGYLTVEA
jgi:hypothetical protein